MDRKLKALYAADLAAFGIYIIGGSVSNTPLMIGSSVVGLGLSSYLVAKVPTQKQREIEGNQKLIELQSELSRVSTERDWLESLNASQSEKLVLAHKQELEALHAHLAAKEEELQAIASRHEAELATVGSSHQSQLAEERESFALEIQQRQSRIVALESDIASLRSQMEQVEFEAAVKLASVEGRAEKLAEVESKLKTELERLQISQKALAVEEKRVRLDIKVERSALKKNLDNAALEIQARDALLAKLKAELSELKEQNQQLFDELYGSKNSQVSDELVTKIQSLLGQNDLKTEFISRENRGGVDFIYLKPESLWKQSTLDNVAQILPGLVDIPQPEISAKNGRIEVKIDNRSMLDKINDAPANWLEKLYFDAAKNGKNLAILGARGGGKTELAKNYIGLVLSHEPDAEVIYIQPKVDDFAVFEVNKRVIEPQYIGFEAITNSAGESFPSAYDGIQYLRNLYSERNSINQRCFADGKPSPKFPKVFFLIDELQVAISREREFIDPEIIKAENLRNGQTYCGKIIRDAISLGRSLGIVVLALGQLPNVSVYGWTKHDLYQYIVLFMAANAPQALDYAPAKEEKKRIESELTLWQKRASIDATKSYYCYVRPMDKAGYLALLPEPGKYLDKADGEEKVTTNAPASKPSTGGEDGFDGRTDGTQKHGFKELALADGIPCQSDKTDEDRLREIRKFKASGETRLSIIIPGVWRDIKGVEVIDSRAYKKARNEYKRLTGE